MANKREKCRRWLGWGVLSAPIGVMLWCHRALRGYALYSEDEVLRASVLHPLFHSEAHFAEAHWRPDMRQHERLAAITSAYNGTVRALERLGLTPFLESSSLIGLLRHQGHMPWEVDGDVGVLQEQCRERGATKAALAAVMDPDFEVLKFACACEEHCEGDDKRMAGRVAHRSSGVVIDIFMYAPVATPRDWQRSSSTTGTEWWERVDDHDDYTFPAETLLPLQNGTFEGVPIWLPQQPREFLSWEYGRCLGVHLWPWRLLLYCPVSGLVPLALLAKGAVSLSGKPGRKASPWLAVVSGAFASVALGLFRGGVALVMLLLGWSCELLAVMLLPALLGPCASGRSADAAAVRRRHRLTQLVSISVLLLELRNCMGQLMCQVDDYYLHPLRPKTWTLCLLSHCWDF